MKRLIIIELPEHEDREFGDILDSFGGSKTLHGYLIHLAVKDAADAVLAVLPNLQKGD